MFCDKRSSCLFEPVEIDPAVELFFLVVRGRLQNGNAILEPYRSFGYASSLIWQHAAPSVRGAPYRLPGLNKDPDMTDRPSAAFPKAVAKNKNVAWLRNPDTIRLHIESASFRARRAPFRVEISNQERPEEIAFPELEHRTEDVSAAGKWAFACILLLSRSLSLCFCPASN